MTTQDQVKKWIVYALALLPLCLLDQYILGRIFLQLPAPLLYPLAVAAVGLWEGPFAGSLYGLGTGAVWWLGGESSLVILLLCLAGLAAGVAVVALSALGQISADAALPLLGLGLAALALAALQG